MHGLRAKICVLFVFESLKDETPLVFSILGGDDLGRGRGHVGEQAAGEAGVRQAPRPAALRVAALHAKPVTLEPKCGEACGKTSAFGFARTLARRALFVFARMFLRQDAPDLTKTTSNCSAATGTIWDPRVEMRTRSPLPWT